jgi:hypothetical protein
MQSTEEYETAPITFKCYGERAIGLYLEDDGVSFEYETDGYNEWLLRVENGQFSANLAQYEYIAPDRHFYIDINGKVDRVELPR